MTEQNTDVQEVTTVSTPTTQRVVQQTRTVKPNIATGSPQKTYDTKKAIFRTYQIIWYILGVVEVVLAFRVVLKLLGASSESVVAYGIIALFQLVKPTNPQEVDQSVDNQ